MNDPVVADVTEPTAAAGGPISHAIFRVARLHKLIAGQLLRETGLYPGQEQVMMRLWDAGPQRQVDLIRMTDSDAATMTRTIRRLQKAGFVRVTASPVDRRAVIVEATDMSQPLRAEVQRIWNRLEELTVADMGPEQRGRALQALRVLEQNLLTIAGGRDGHGQATDVT